MTVRPDPSHDEACGPYTGWPGPAYPQSNPKYNPHCTHRVPTVYPTSRHLHWLRELPKTKKILLTRPSPGTHTQVSVSALLHSSYGQVRIILSSFPLGAALRCGVRAHMLAAFLPAMSEARGKRRNMIYPLKTTLDEACCIVPGSYPIDS